MIQILSLFLRKSRCLTVTTQSLHYVCLLAGTNVEERGP